MSSPQNKSENICAIASSIAWPRHSSAKYSRRSIHSTVDKSLLTCRNVSGQSSLSLAFRGAGSGNLSCGPSPFTLMLDVNIFVVIICLLYVVCVCVYVYARSYDENKLSLVEARSRLG